MEVIKAADLRIGNIFDYHGVWVYVMSITKSGAEFGYFSGTQGYSEGFVRALNKDFPKPVPLTEEILLRAAFVEKDKWFYKEKFLLGYLTTDNNLQAEWKFAGTEGGCNLINIYYLHQLQNIIHSLSGTEINLK